MVLSDLDNWVEKARKLTCDLEWDESPKVIFRNDSNDIENNPMKTAYNGVVDVEYSYRSNTLTFVLE
jgi:hypothetical protein